MEEILEAFLDSSPNPRDGLIADSLGIMVLVNFTSLSNGCVNMETLSTKECSCAHLCPSLLSNRTGVWGTESSREVAEEEASGAVLDTPFLKPLYLNNQREHPRTPHPHPFPSQKAFNASYYQ